MLFKLDTKNHTVTKTKKQKLIEIGWQEEDLQKLLYDNLAQIFPEDELLLMMQSIKGKEEPDLLALDPLGNLNIFELKRWESVEVNLLQALRYGQIFGQYDYKSLNERFHKFNPSSGNLLQVLNEKFTVQLTEAEINKTQKFIIITNGIDHKTRNAIKYWASQGIQIQSWIYRIHNLSNETLIEFDKFKILDNPFEDMDEGYYILNTNLQGGQEDEDNMLREGKAAAFFEPWKNKIEYIKKGDRIFLYRSGTGIIAKGIASGRLDKKSYRNNSENTNDEYSQKLKEFKILKKPISASDIKKISGVNYVFMQTLFAIDSETGKKIWEIDQ
jgi:hypothetical protein